MLRLDWEKLDQLWAMDKLWKLKIIGKATKTFNSNVKAVLFYASES